MSEVFESRFADYLRAQEILGAAEIKQLLSHQAETKVSLAKAALHLGFLDEVGLLTAWAEMNGSAVHSREDLKVEGEVLRLVPRDLCARYSLLPLRIEDGMLVVATNDPTDPEAVDELRFLTGLPITFRVAGSDDIAQSIKEAYPPEIVAPPESVENADSPVIGEVQKIFREAIDQRASHVHLEPSETGVQLLFRVRGVLKEVRRIPSSLLPGITARLKILGELDIAERRMPQTGKIRLSSDGQVAEFALSTLPTAFYRERLTLRRMDGEPPIPRPEELGFGPDVSTSLARLLGARRGLFIVAGEGGSGRTTTLYSLACGLSKAGRKVLSVEDGVLRRMSEFTQIVPSSKSSFPASMAVRHALRQDPDVLVVDTSLQAEVLDLLVGGASAGRLVLAAMFAPSVLGAFERMCGMAEGKYLLSRMLLGVLGQNLFRVLCPSCKAPETLSGDVAAKFGLAGHPTYAPRGCPACQGSGYVGRTPAGLFVRIGPEWQGFIDSNAMAPPQGEASGGGRDALLRAALGLVLAGTTSLEEALGRTGVW